MRAILAAILLSATPAHADVVADIVAENIDCRHQRIDYGRQLRQCIVDRYQLKQQPPDYAPWLAWGLGVAGASLVAGGIAAGDGHRNIGIFSIGVGGILVVAGGYAAGW